MLIIDNFEIHDFFCEHHLKVFKDHQKLELTPEIQDLLQSLVFRLDYFEELLIDNDIEY